MFWLHVNMQRALGMFPVLKLFVLNAGEEAMFTVCVPAFGHSHWAPRSQLEAASIPSVCWLLGGNKKISSLNLGSFPGTLVFLSHRKTPGYSPSIPQE